MSNNMKFVNVDILAAMEQIVNIHTEHYQSDFFEVDVPMLREASEKKERQDKTFLWLCRTMGTWLLKERNIFLKDTRESNTFRFYQEQTSEPIIALAVEIYGLIGNRVIGNLYPIDYESHYRHVLTKSINTSAIMHYENGCRVIPASNITLYGDATYGNLLDWEYLPESVDDLSAVLWKERQQREDCPVGDLNAYLAAL